MNQMPTMPLMNDKNKDDVSSDMSVSSLSGEVSNDASLGEELKAPNHEDKPVEYVDASKSSSEVETPIVSRNGIAVKATRLGFFANRRYKKGDTFNVMTFQQLGDWMTCEDPIIERKRLEFIKSKKAKK